MAGTQIANLIAFLTLNDSDYKKKMNEARGEASHFGNVIQGIFQGIGQRLFSGIVDGLGALVGKMGEAVQASSNLNETINKTGVVFGSSAQDVVKWSETSATAFGLSQRAALDATGQFGALFRQMGDLPAAAATTSQGLVSIASDLASIYNIPVESALEKLQAGLIGEIRPLRDVNIFLNEHIVAQKAVALGLAASTDAVDESAKVHARYALIVEQAKIAEGDFTRTSHGLANAQRILAAEMEDGAARLGNTFRPAVEAITSTLIGLAPQMFAYGQNITDQLANGLAAGIRAIIPVITVVRQLLAYWFAPGSPPRVAPDIDKWGAAAMGQFLSGFASVDFKSAFAGVGQALETILRSQVTAGKDDEGGLVSRIFGTRDAIANAVSEFARTGSLTESTINKIVRSAGSAGKGIGDLVRAYFDLQKASSATTRAQEQLNRVTEKYDAILNPLTSELDAVRAQQQQLANQQRLIAAQNTLANFDSTEAEKEAARLEIKQISLENQISTVEQQKQAETDKAQAAVDSAKKEEDAAKKKLDAAQAYIDIQVEQNNLIGEQLRYEQQLAAQREADAQRAQSEAEQAANKAKQQAEEAQRLADQLHDAQLRYNLELADTPGKIKLMEAELAKTKVGSVEYFQILTQIHQLQEQYNKELEQAANGAGALAAVDLTAGPGGGLAAQLGEQSKAGQNLAKALQEAFAPIPAASGKVAELAEKINFLVTKIGALFGIDFSTWGQNNLAATDTASQAWDHYGERVDAANASSRAAIDGTASKITQFVTLLTDIVNGDWAKLWEDYKNFTLAAYSTVDAETETKLNRQKLLIDLFQYATRTSWSQYWADWTLIWQTGLDKAGLLLDGWKEKTISSITNFGSSLYSAGQGLLDQFWNGLKAKWGELSSWFTSSLQGLRNQLPFSEPKDASSPLRGLAKSGESMVNMIQSGIDKASFNVNSLAGSLVPAGATTNNSTSNNTHNSITINVANGSKDEVLRALRSAGLA